MSLFKAMLVKEVKTGLRERQQMVGVVILLVVVMTLTILGISGYREGRRARAMLATAFPRTQPASHPATAPSAGPAKPSTQPGVNELRDPAAAALDALSPMSPQTLALMLRWGAVGAGTGVGIFFALGHLLAAALATFAGEKDNGTLEVLLASPVSDTRLYLFKCASVLIPSAVLGYLFVLIPAGTALLALRTELGELPVNVAVHALVLSVPLVVLIDLILVAVAAAVSAKTESLKGASQVFGGIVFVLVFLPNIGILLIARSKTLRPLLKQFALRLADYGFGLQYVCVLAVLATIAPLALAAGRSLFRRDRLVA